ncbi:MAG: sulfatase family protein, partial [Acidobacteriota bacterium]
GLMFWTFLAAHAVEKPNVIIVIADDMGFFDTGYNGNKILKTPVLNEMAAKGILFDYFYAAGKLCCPGRFAILTGRAPMRGGLNGNEKIRPNEITIAKMLKQAGYRTGYFGKWHLGRRETSPVGMGFQQAIWIMNQYNVNPEFEIQDTKEILSLKGDGSVAVVDLGIKFIREQAKNGQPFLVTLGFASPHEPYLPAPEFFALYKDQPKAVAVFAGEITGMDTAVGKLRQELRRLGIADNTMLWFISDNGGIQMSSKDPAGRGKGKIGTRTIGLLEWPARVPEPRRLNVPCGHIDIYPTILDAIGQQPPELPIIDGISLLPVLDGKVNTRSKPLPFFLLDYGSTSYMRVDFVKDSQGIWIDGSYEL